MSLASPTPLLTAEQLAAALQISIPTVRFWQQQGIPFQPVGRLRRYRLEEVLAWLQHRTQSDGSS